jgi:hypothetical protein
VRRAGLREALVVVVVVVASRPKRFDDGVPSSIPFRGFGGDRDRDLAL